MSIIAGVVSLGLVGRGGRLSSYDTKVLVLYCTAPKFCPSRLCSTGCKSRKPRLWNIQNFGHVPPYALVLRRKISHRLVVHS